jgi:hypothetical protein
VLWSAGADCSWLLEWGAHEGTGIDSHRMRSGPVREE